MAVSRHGIHGPIFGEQVNATNVYFAYVQQGPGPIVVDATSVYWANDDTTGTLMKVPLGGGIPETLASGGVCSGIAVDDTSVYWTDEGSQPGLADGLVRKLTPK
jgi:hypothetical protein